MKGINKDRFIFRHLNDLLKSSPEIVLDQKSKWVIFSDLHLGDGSKKDDFKPNSDLFLTSLKKYYMKHNFKVVLNGDIEEVQRFAIEKIIAAWPELYWLFNELNQKESLIKIVGNHDLNLLLNKGKDSFYPIHHSMKMIWKDDSVFIFHGHQASRKYLKYNKLLGITLKYLANPLRIGNYSVAHNSRKQFAIEKVVYRFSVIQGVLSIIGHTHRPLFESLSKAERLRYTIERLCRIYMTIENDKEKKKIRKSIKNYKKELVRILKKDAESISRRNIYNTTITIPCLFNSGCVIGKRGLTAIEIEKGCIRLVHWFDKKISKKYLKNYGYDPIPLRNTDYYRMIINEESLDYIFSRIKLLS